MATGALKKIFFGFSLGIAFVILSGFLTGGILLSELIPIPNSTVTFFVIGIPYGFIAGVLHLVFAIKRNIKENHLNSSILFGIGFWLSFLSLYVISYFALSSFGF